MDIIIPTYNREKLISRSVLSCLNQTYKNIEVIVIDDCSTDNTEQVIKKIDDKRLKYYKLKSNKGACYARNYCVKKSKGNYIAFQDSDDYFYPDKIEKQLNNMLNSNSQVDFCTMDSYLNENFHVIYPSKEKINNIFKNGFVDELCNGNYISTGLLVLQKKLFDKYNFDEKLPRYQDYDFMLQIVSNVSFSITNEVLIEVYRQNDSISSNIEKMKNALKLMKQKDYGLSKKQLAKLHLTLDNNYINELEYKIYLLNHQINEISKNKDAEINDIKDKYYKIINSKRWKFIDRLGNIIKKH